MTTEILARVIEPNGKFVGGVVLWNDTVIEAAPILGYMKRGKNGRGWTRDQVRKYCADRGWKVELVSQSERRDVDDKGRSRR